MHNNETMAHSLIWHEPRGVGEPGQFCDPNSAPVCPDCVDDSLQVLAGVFLVHALQQSRLCRVGARVLRGSEPTAQDLIDPVETQGAALCHEFYAVFQGDHGMPQAAAELAEVSFGVLCVHDLLQRSRQMKAQMSQQLLSARQAHMKFAKRCRALLPTQKTLTPRTLTSPPHEGQQIHHGS